MTTPDGIVMLTPLTNQVTREQVIEAAPEAYVSYFENDRGEQLVFFRRRTEQHATLWHGKIALKPVRISATVQPFLGLSLDGDELDWLNACRRASGLTLRQPSDPAELPDDQRDESFHRVAAATYEHQIRQGFEAVFGSQPEEELVAMLGQMVDRLSRAAAIRLIGGTMPSGEDPTG